jgi:glycosyltransferase involved in cell wall biosynthesis
MRVLYVAAHGGFAHENVPLGGGGAVCDHLAAEWLRTRPFELTLITPAILGERAPNGADLVRFRERDYARFCRAFERAATEEVLCADPTSTVVLVNDISEGPDFARLAARGFRIFTIYHVDVVAYFASIYLRGWIRPETSVRWYRRLKAVLPPMAQLIWKKQEASVLHSRGLIVPSADMRAIVRRCYPECPAEKIHVVPWGVWEPSQTRGEPAASAASLRREYGISDDAQVLLTLSRISPEKGQHQLLRALEEWEGRADFPHRPLWLFVCGEPAYMQGRRYFEHLKRWASRLRRTRVIFPGHVTGARKQAFFELAHLYVFPSTHESYGLTLLEALHAGVPAVCLDHAGARSVMREEFGRIVPPDGLRAAVAELLSDDALRGEMGRAARAFALTQRFSESAARVASLLVE